MKLEIILRADDGSGFVVADVVEAETYEEACAGLANAFEELSAAFRKGNGS